MLVQAPIDLTRVAEKGTEKSGKKHRATLREAPGEKFQK